MKMRIAYTEDERRDIQSIIEHVKGRFSSTKVRETVPKDGFLHTVLTVKMPGKARK